MGERRGTKGLELWCRRMTEGYPGVKIDNMTTSWRDGLAFCAIIHHFRPDLIEFSKLNKNDVYHNNELAFRIGEHHLGIPALLEPEDMVEFPVPDRLSILTYLSQFYQAFAVPQGSSQARIAPKRPQSSPDHGIVSPASSSPPAKVALIGAGKARREPCAKCGLPVFLAERLNVGKLLYHRTCFRCARCTSQLTLDNYYETENGDYCCETCPDEEKLSMMAVTRSETVGDQSVLLRSMSDEEKSANLKAKEETDEYSAQFETALEFPVDGSLKRNFTLSSEQSKVFTRARSNFIQSQMVSSSSDGDSGTEDEPPPDLPTSQKPVLDKSELGFSKDIDSSLDVNSAHFDSGFPSNSNVNSNNNDRLDKSVNIEESKHISSISNQYETASEQLEKTHNVVTKDEEAVVSPTTAASLVRARMQFFESNKSTDVKDVRKSDACSVLKPSVELVNQQIDDDVQQPQQHNNTDSTETSSVVTVLDSSEEERCLADASGLVAIVLESIEDVSEVKTEDSDSVIVIDSFDSHGYDENVEVVEKSVGGVIEDATTSKEIATVITVEPAVEIPAAPEKDVEYPDDLNPFGDDDEVQTVTPPLAPVDVQSLNPFDDEENVVGPPVKPVPSPRLKKKIIPTASEKEVTGTPECLSSIYIDRVSVNPFESDDDDEAKRVEAKPPLPINRKKKIIEAPKISLNPFWSSGDETEDKGAVKKPVPTPRPSRTTMEVAEGGKLQPGDGNVFGSNSSLSSTSTTSNVTLRKKKPAPKPPTSFKSDAVESSPSSLASSPCHSLQHSPRSTPKFRKSKKAPLPPSYSSTPLEKDHATAKLSFCASPIGLNTLEQPEERPENEVGDYESEKIAKDELNRNRQSQIINVNSPTSSENSSSLSMPNKSTYGKWKRRKGQAPSRPIPQKRSIKALPIEDIRRELDVIEIQLQGLEKQGVRLEQIIREKCEGGGTNETPNPAEETLPPEAEDMILQLFELVNEKNELFRKQAELMYLRRQQRLEEEYADVEYQIRCLMHQPEANKTDSDKAREEELINRLVEIVERRNEIIDCLEMDRVREAEEDDSINNHLNLYSLKKDEVKVESPHKSKKDKKKHKKEKRFKLKGHKIDADKDIDESETSTNLTMEKKKKKKLNLF